jgi:FkbH-like protein
MIDTEMIAENNTSATLREEADQLIASGKVELAAAMLAQLWDVEGANPASASFLVSRFEKLRGKLLFVSCRLAILRSFTLEPVVPICRAQAFLAGIDLTVHLGDFNTYIQDLSDRQSPLYAFNPDVVILAVLSRDVAARLWRDWSDLPEANIIEEIQAVTGTFHNCVSSFRRNSSAHLIIHSLEIPVMPAWGMLDAQLRCSQVAAFCEINREQRNIAQEYRGVYLLDYDSLVSRYGRLSWHDERKWLAVRMSFAAEHSVHLAREWLRLLHPLTGRVAKALALDLDNTVWGGIIGEDGVAGIRLGAEYPGAGYVSFQRALLDLHRRGILLTICSKNNFEDAIEVLEKHPDMLLRPKHFASMRINWNDKEQNLREIAAELNIGLDSLVFVDDNPVERQRIRANLAEVYVLDLPSDSMQYERAVRDCPLFERVTLSVEDVERGDLYQAQRERTTFRQNAESREDFYRSLRQVAKVARVADATLTRVAQLTQKTSQFNLTTRRHSEQRIREMTVAPNWDVYSIEVRDRFGNNGLVGVAITHHMGETWEIDTFLLSCRVIGRTVEIAFLAFLLDQAQAEGAARIQGWFLPTKKNASAKDFYASHGFYPVLENEKGCLWALDLPQQSVRCPEWIKLSIADGES